MCVWRRRESELVDVAIDVPVGRHVARLHLLDEVSTPGNDELPQFLLVRAISIRRRRYYSEGKKKTICIHWGSIRRCRGERRREHRGCGTADFSAADSTVTAPSRPLPSGPPSRDARAVSAEKVIFERQEI
jgi:hypothetical protein